MAIKLFGKKDEKEVDFFATNDMLVVFDHSKNTSDIVRVTDLDEDAVVAAGRYKVPRLDCEVTTGPEGRIFFYRAPTESVQEVERLALLEYNTVLSQITAFRPPVPPASMDWTKGILFALLFVAFILIAVT